MKIHLSLNNRKNDAENVQISQKMTYNQNNLSPMYCHLVNKNPLEKIKASKPLNISPQTP